MKFADTGIAAAGKFALNQLEDRGIVEPAANVTADPVGTNEGDDPDVLHLRIDQRPRTVVGPAVGQDADDPLGPQQFDDLPERHERGGLPVVVQVGVEKRQALLGEEWHRQQSEQTTTGNVQVTLQVTPPLAERVHAAPPAGNS